MSMVTKNGFKFYCEEITQPTLLINAVTEALTELIDYEHTDHVLKVISNNFRTVLKQFHKSSMEKREITEEPKEEMLIKKW